MRKPVTFLIADESGGIIFGLGLSIMEAANREVVYYALPRGSDFGSFMLDVSAIRMLLLADNEDGRMHDNTPWDFARAAANSPADTSGSPPFPQLGPVDLFRVERSLGGSWPADPNIASVWQTYEIQNDSGDLMGYRFLAVEAQNNTWARREAEFIGGPRQRLTELLVLETFDPTMAGLGMEAPIAFPLNPQVPIKYVPAALASPVITPPSEPSFGWVLDQQTAPKSIVIQYAAMAQWSQDGRADRCPNVRRGFATPERLVDRRGGSLQRDHTVRGSDTRDLQRRYHRRPSQGADVAERRCRRNHCGRRELDGGHSRG